MKRKTKTLNLNWQQPHRDERWTTESRHGLIGSVCREANTFAGSEQFKARAEDLMGHMEWQRGFLSLRQAQGWVGRQLFNHEQRLAALVAGRAW